MEEKAIFYKGNSLIFYLERKNVKNINLRIRTDGTVVVSAHNKVPVKIICSFLQEKAPWILERKQSLQQNSITPFRRLPGEPYTILGESYTLQVIQSKAASCSIKEECLQIFTPAPDDLDEIGNLLDQWTYTLAETELKQALMRMLPFADIDFIPALKIRRMKSCWGTCNFSKRIVTLNMLLIHYQRECIDYVALHELLHFHNPTHNKQFNAAMTKLMPDWKLRRKLLNGQKTGL